MRFMSFMSSSCRRSGGSSQSLSSKTALKFAFRRYTNAVQLQLQQQECSLSSFQCVEVASGFARTPAQCGVHQQSCIVSCRLNKCGVISPRYDLRHGDIETWIAKLLPSRLVRPALPSVA